jgi:hypothetical protein
LAPYYRRICIEDTNLPSTEELWSK